MKKIGYFLLLISLSLIARAAASGPAVLVEKDPVHVLRKTFNRDHLPPDMPPLTPLEAGLCDHRFFCETKLQVSMPPIKRGRVSATLTSLTVTIRLEIVIWTEENTAPKIVAHEEAHREIAEHYYLHADFIAHHFAEKIIGQKIQVEVRNTQPDLEGALRDIQNGVVAQYLDETARRCIFAQDRFDTITDHSRNLIPEADAMAEALNDEETHHAKKQ